MRRAASRYLSETCDQILKKIVHLGSGQQVLPGSFEKSFHSRHAFPGYQSSENCRWEANHLRLHKGSKKQRAHQPLEYVH